MNYRITYQRLDKKGEESVTIVGPCDSDEADCLRVVGIASTNYGVDMSTLEIKTVPERTSHGFLHPVMALAKGYPEPIPITRWYF